MPFPENCNANHNQKSKNECTKLIFELNPDIPMTILSFFPAYKMKNSKPPALSDMVRIYHRVKEIGLNNVKLGNCGVFAKSNQDWERLLNEIGKEGIG